MVIPINVQEPAIAFRVEQLFGSRTRVRLLGLLLDKPDDRFFVRDLSRRIDAQVNAVRRELKNLVEVGILLESGEEEEAGGDGEEESNRGRSGLENKGTVMIDSGGKPLADHISKRYFSANRAFPLFEDLSKLFKKMALMMNGTLVASLKLAGTVELIILTGAFTDVQNIRTDLLIVGDLKPEEALKAVQEFERDIGRTVAYTLMPHDEFVYRRDIGDRFLMSVLQARRVILLGDPAEI